MSAEGLEERQLLCGEWGLEVASNAPLSVAFEAESPAAVAAHVIPQQSTSPWLGTLVAGQSPQIASAADAVAAAGPVGGQGGNQEPGALSRERATVLPELSLPVDATHLSLATLDSFLATNPPNATGMDVLGDQAAVPENVPRQPTTERIGDDANELHSDRELPHDEATRPRNTGPAADRDHDAPTEAAVAETNGQATADGGTNATATHGQTNAGQQVNREEAGAETETDAGSESRQSLEEARLEWLRRDLEFTESEAEGHRDWAKRLRELASKWRQLAENAEQNADKSRDPRDAQRWQQSAERYGDRADQLEQDARRADERAADADGRANDLQNQIDQLERRDQNSATQDGNSDGTTPPTNDPAAGEAGRPSTTAPAPAGTAPGGTTGTGGHGLPNSSGSRPPRPRDGESSTGEKVLEIAVTAASSQATGSELIGGTQALGETLVVATQQRETDKKNTGDDRFGRKIREDLGHGHYNQFDGGANLPWWVWIIEIFK